MYVFLGVLACCADTESCPNHAVVVTTIPTTLAVTMLKLDFTFNPPICYLKDNLSIDSHGSEIPNHLQSQAAFTR